MEWSRVDARGVGSRARLDFLDDMVCGRRFVGGCEDDRVCVGEEESWNVVGCNVVRYFLLW